MIKLNSHELLTLFPQSDLANVEYSINSVVIDSRKCAQGSLFVAIRGEHFNGHQFIDKAAEKGAVVAIVDTLVKGVKLPQILVPDTRQALARLAYFWLHKINPWVISITGSNGKTTVKEMLGHILKGSELSGQGGTLMTPGNFNNDIGVPLTLFQLSETDRFAVIEMGANHKHEIELLVSIADPNVVYVNNAGNAHIEGFGSLQAVIEAKGEMYQNCDPNAVAVFNKDEVSYEYWKSISATGNHLTFSSKQPADVTAVGQQFENGLLLTVNYQQQQFSCRLNVIGEHNLQNALAAITLAIASGLTAQQACQQLNGFSGVNGRLQFVTGLNNSVIINDSYNANPDSLNAAIKVLCSLDGKPWLALGDMAELGDRSLQIHQQALLDARKAGVQKCFTLGEYSCQAVNVFGKNGYCFKQHNEMVDFISTHLDEGINLLVKGSRSAGMEKVVEKLTINNNQYNTTGVAHAL